MALTALTTLPASLLAPATVLTRLRLETEDLPALTDILEEASGLAIRYLRFEPRYGAFQETVQNVRGDRLYLGARPLVAVSGLLDRGDSTVDPALFPYDNNGAWLYNHGGWGYGEASSLYGPAPLLVGGYTGTTWDWTVTYRAGWWCDTHAVGDPVATRPADVPPLPSEIRRDVLAITRWLWGKEAAGGGAAALGIKRMKDEGSEVEFFASDETDAETGIPINLTIGMSSYRRAM
jgi:hypothetical protein